MQHHDRLAVEGRFEHALFAEVVEDHGDGLALAADGDDPGLGRETVVVAGRVAASAAGAVAVLGGVGSPSFERTGRRR